MPWEKMPKKDVAGCEKRRGAAEQALIRRYPNGETFSFEERELSEVLPRDPSTVYSINDRSPYGTKERR